MRNELDDPFDELFSGERRTESRQMVRDIPAAAPAAQDAFIENCPSCRGRGRFISFAGRDCGPCFKCKGKGKRSFATSPETRAKARAGAAERKVNKAEQACHEFKAAHAAEYAWMLANVEKFDFATNMWHALRTYGDLTAGQLAAVQRCVEREQARIVERAAREASAPVVEGVDLLKVAFDKAVAYSAEKGLKLSPRITVAGITISPAKANSKNAGALYVKSGNDYLGKIAGGRFQATQACTDEQQAKVIAFVANPAEAAKIYGQTTGTCCVCNATLISKWKHRGIGPICAEKFGWVE